MSMDSPKPEEGVDFSDARDEFSILGCESECGSGCSRDSRSSFDENDIVFKCLNYDLWAKEPIISIDERRHKFLGHTGGELERWRSCRENVGGVVIEDEAVGIEEEEEETKAITLKGEEIDQEDSDSASMSSKYGKCASNVGQIVIAGGPVHRRIASGSLSHAEEGSALVNWMHHHFGKTRELVDVEHLEHLKHKERKEGWLKRISFKGSFTAVKERRNEGLESDGSSSHGAGNPGVHVSTHRKQWKELSCMYLRQDFDAHDGCILAMKFSPDGKRLATGGQDGTLRIWEVVEDEGSPELDVLGLDQSYLYVSANGVANVDTFNKIKKQKKLPEKACIISPKKFFRIPETPLHEFHDHEGAVLDLSWSANGSLLTSSVDKTVRLWQPGQDHCVRVFTHHNFVTCVQFNPVDNNIFISGSIDGKVRIWSILLWKVIHWIDIKEIVTAICYRPDGKGAIAGTISGHCHFYDIIDNRLHSDSKICLEGKKSPTRRINSFQFSPSDPNKVIVASGDSQVRVLIGCSVVGKLKGIHNGRMNMSASFTVEGKYVVSASPDSNVCIWDCSSASGTQCCYRTNDVRSCESFHSENAMIAIPWHGYKGVSNKLRHHHTIKELESLSNRLLAMALPSAGEGHAKHYKDMRERTVSSEMWGAVIVTGGSDGRIRTYHNYGLPIRT